MKVARALKCNAQKFLILPRDNVCVIYGKPENIQYKINYTLIPI